ncbi:MAG: hypothetical protein IH987_07115, partial [Planctomycetes bacterium]|nr:hypothetical protein [Planctomycetota bacterium]
ARLLAAEWALDDRDATRALAVLGELAPGVARRTQALRLRLQASRLARQPLEALRTARLLAKHQAFSKAAAQSLLRSLAFEALDGARDVDQLRAAWQQLDGADRRDPLVASRAAQCAAQLGAPDDGRGWLRPFFDNLAELQADDRAALATALVPVLAGCGPDWLQRLEAAQTRFPRERALAYALGHALAERQLWGKARLMLETVAEDSGMPNASRRRSWLALAALAEQEGDDARRARCFESFGTAAKRIPTSTIPLQSRRTTVSPHRTPACRPHFVESDTAARSIRKATANNSEGHAAKSNRPTMYVGSQSHECVNDVSRYARLKITRKPIVRVRPCETGGSVGRRRTDGNTTTQMTTVIGIHRAMNAKRAPHSSDTASSATASDPKYAG